jgi:hypothetical protein
MPRLRDDHLLLLRREGPIAGHIGEVSTAFTVDDEWIPSSEYPVTEGLFEFFEYL